jgi:hypothetical protein
VGIMQKEPIKGVTFYSTRWRIFVVQKTPPLTTREKTNHNTSYLPRSADHDG